MDIPQIYSMTNKSDEKPKPNHVLVCLSMFSELSSQSVTLSAKPIAHKYIIIFYKKAIFQLFSRQGYGTLVSIYIAARLCVCGIDSN